MHIDKTTLASTISEAVVFAVAAAGTFALHHKWLSGWQQYEQSLYQVEQVAAPLMAGAKAPLPGIEGQLISGMGQVAKDALASSTPGVALQEQATTNGQPAADAATNGSPGMILIDSILPALGDELASVPTGQGHGPAASASRPDSAVKPDTPVGELQHVGI
jgi:hypothetical protein